MSAIVLKLDDAQWQDLRYALQDVRSAVPKAAAAALNRTAQSGATRIRRRLAGVLGMGVRALGDRVKAVATTPQQLEAKIRLYNFNLPLIKTNQVPSGAGTYLLSKEADEGKATAHPPFKQTMPSGHLGWFVRYGEKRLMTKGRYQGKKREPITELFAPAPRKVFEQTPGLAEDELGQLGAILDKNLASQVSRFTHGAISAA